MEYTVEHCKDNEEASFVWAWENLPKDTDIKQYIEDNGLEICLMRESTQHIVAGFRNETGLWVPKQYKNYWLRERR